MPETDYVKRGEVNEIRDRLVTVETNQEHAENNINALRSQMNEGFSKISQQITDLSNRKTMLLTVAGGIGGGLAVGLFDLIKHVIGG